MISKQIGKLFKRGGEREEKTRKTKERNSRKGKESGKRRGRKEERRKKDIRTKGMVRKKGKSFQIGHGEAFKIDGSIQYATLIFSLRGNILIVSLFFWKRGRAAAPFAPPPHPP